MNKTFSDQSNSKPLSEFDIIDRYCKRNTPSPKSLLVGIGDDCAVFTPTPELATCYSTDSYHADVHFFADMAAEDIAIRTLSASLSDLAAMGATPTYIAIALSLPKAEHAWLTAFTNAIFELTDREQITLIGGDTTKGPFTITYSVFGEVDPQNMLTRSGATVGDVIYVSGTLGTAGFGLEEIKQQRQADKSEADNPQADDPQADNPQADNPQAAKPIATFQTASPAQAHYLRPTPQLALGQALASLGATAAIDISDGFIADLSKLLVASNVSGAIINTHSIPIDDYVKQQCDSGKALTLACEAGDDYQLVFTLPEQIAADKKSEDILSKYECVAVGKVSNEEGIWLADQNGKKELEVKGYDHFI